MTRPGTPDRPLRVAVVGSGPAGFYTVQHLFQDKELAVRVDMFDRLPTPFGLVRAGVAPDHPKIKSVTAVYHKLAGRPEFRFFGNVEYGRDVTLEDLRTLYDHVVFCTGAQTDRRLGIPGEDLAGSHPATEFVAWYNGHPDFADLHFDLEQESAVVVGVGNVAVDVARILCRTPDELARTDIADHALEALRHSRVRTVHLLGRRGPAQAAFTNPEVKELGELAGTETSTLAKEVELDPVSRAAVERSADKATWRKLEILQGLVDRRQPERARRLILRFLVSPVEILGDDSGRVRAVRLVRNELVCGGGGGGGIRAVPTGHHEEIPAGLVFRSVGYRGIRLPGLPFRDDWGTLPNDAGRILEAPGGKPLPGLYAAGWIKRGPTGVIGTNKPDALETVRSMIADLPSTGTARPGADAIEELLRTRGVRWVSYEDWERIDAVEVSRGSKQQRPRIKLVRHADFMRVLAD